MLSIDQFILGNKLIDQNTGLESIIHIDHAFISLGNQVQTFSLETTGVTLNGSFRSFRDYVFAIQNGTFQYSGMCYSMASIEINSDQVRIQQRDGITRAFIRNNSLIENMGNEIRLAEPVRVHVPVTPRPRPKPRPATLRELSRDNQNVHDSFILDKFTDIYNSLGSPSLTWLECCRKLMQVDGSENLARVLYYIETQDGYIYKFKTSESQVLIKVTSFIKDNRDALNILTNSLRDCLQGDEFVCLTGRVARMVNSIEYLVVKKLKAKDCRPILLGQASKIEYRSMNELIRILERNNENTEGIREEVLSWGLPESF